MVVNNKDNITKIGLLFYICSIVGYIYEMILCLIDNGKFLSHGILFGPWLPIYGTGAVLIFTLRKYRKKPLIIFMLSFLLSGILEWICGYLLLNFLNIRLWDYRGWFLNLNGFVCFLSAFIFGCGGIFIIYFLLPVIEKIIRNCKRKNLILFLSGLSLLFSIDLICTIFKLN